MLLSNLYADYKDSHKQFLNVVDTVCADALRALRAGGYSDAINKFKSVQEEYPSVGVSEIIGYIGYCKVKKINFDDGEKHSLGYVCKQIDLITDDSLKSDLMRLPQIKTLKILEGKWKSNNKSLTLQKAFTFQNGCFTYGTVDEIEESKKLSVYYYNGHYCTSYHNSNGYAEIYNISQNQISYRVLINGGYMNNATLTRVS